MASAGSSIMGLVEVYLVGGAVRDRLLGLPARERDWVVVGATPTQLLDQGYRQVGKDFPVFLHPDTGEEYALARREKKVAPGYHGFQFEFGPEVSLQEDLSRRDLTVNAMAMSETGELIDPFDGRNDLRERVLRHVSPAFREDPLRVVRVARFAARFAPLGFKVDQSTITLMNTIVLDGELSALRPERFWQELQRAMGEPAPQMFVSTLRDCDALRILLPEVDQLFGVPQPQRWHPEIDTGVHLLMTLAQGARISKASEIRFAILTHDLGKGVTPREQWPQHNGHEERSVDLIQGLSARLPVPKRFLELAIIVARYHGLCHRAFELRPTTLLKLLERTDGIRRPERFEAFLLACEADARGRTGLEDRPYRQGTLLRSILQRTASVDPPDTNDLSGPQIAEKLREGRLAAIRETLTNFADQEPP